MQENSGPPLPDQTGSGVKEKRKGKKRSWVWLEGHFKEGVDAQGKEFGTCSYCNSQIAADTNIHGTGGLINHLTRCDLYPPNVELNKAKQARLTIRPNEHGKSTVMNWKFDQELIRQALTRMIVIDELPFSFVEGEGFKQFMDVACPNFRILSRQTMGRDCLKLYQFEFENMKNFFKSSCERICFTTDTWTSNQRINYMVITPHCIDNDWKFHKRIINFCPITSHKGEHVGSEILNCLRNWELCEKVFTFTMDNASSNDSAISSFKRKMGSWDSSILNGNYVHIRCIAHVINLAVKDGLKEIEKSIEKVRGVVRYVRQSPARLHKFKKCAEMEKIKSKKSLCLDVPTRWNSTYTMLDTTQIYERAFDRLEELDISYKYDFEKRTHVDEFDNVLPEPIVIDFRPSGKDWAKCRVFAQLLKYFYDLTIKISGSLYVTSNNALQEICGIYSLLKEWKISEDPEVKEMGNKMKEKFDKYWGDPGKMNSLIYIAMVLDPRYKLEFVRYALVEMHGDDMGKKVGDKLSSTLVLLYNDYKAKKEGHVDGSNTQIVSNIVSTNENQSQTQLLYAKFHKEKMQKGGLGSGSGSELDKYLTEIAEDPTKDLDLLDWWKQNSHSHRFPILSSMAHDVLAIPVSTVASESAFSTGGHVLDSFRSSLSPKVVECLICTQDWIRASKSLPITLEEQLVESEELEKELSKLTMEDVVDIHITSI